MVKTAGLYLVPVKGYSKNTHPPSFLERAVVMISAKRMNRDEQSQASRKISVTCCEKL
jgi:hypothetical protein